VDGTCYRVLRASLSDRDEQHVRRQGLKLTQELLKRNGFTLYNCPSSGRGWRKDYNVVLSHRSLASKTPLAVCPVGEKATCIPESLSPVGVTTGLPTRGNRRMAQSRIDKWGKVNVNGYGDPDVPLAQQ
jgi:hypothetical protein